MLDSIQIGMVRLNEREKAVGYMRSIKKNDPSGPVHGYFRIPLYVVFDCEGYNTYKEYLRKENPEFKTWVSNIVLQVPPNEKQSKHYHKAGHEMFLGKLRDMAKFFPKFPGPLRQEVMTAVDRYAKAKKNAPPPPENVHEAEEYISPEMELISQEAIRIYSKLLKSRFDSGRPNRKGEFMIAPFIRVKGDKMAREVIDQITSLVCDFLLRNPKVSKFSETEGHGLRIKLGTLFLECFYKEQLHFMQTRLKTISQQ